MSAFDPLWTLGHQSLWSPSRGLERNGMLRRIDWRLNAGALLPVLLLCLLARGIIPAGWMPTFTAQGVSLVLCSGTAVEPASRPSAHNQHGAHADQDSSGKSHDDSDKSKHDMANQPCSFAAATVDLPWPDAPAAIFTPTDSDLQFDRFHAVALGRGLAAPPPPSTGPPITA